MRAFRAYPIRGSPRWGVAKLVKAPDFDSGMRRFESFLPSHEDKGVGQNQRLPLFSFGALAGSKPPLPEKQATFTGLANKRYRDLLNERKRK